MQAHRDCRNQASMEFRRTVARLRGEGQSYLQKEGMEVEWAMKKPLHDPDCQKAIDTAKANIEEWLKRWPKHCTKCDGWGGFFSTYDPSPSGVSLSPGYMDDYEPCDCIEECSCPRCGKRVPFGYAHPEKDGEFIDVCSYCGWDSRKPDGKPSEPECWCWMRRMDEEYLEERGNQDECNGMA
jgi:hypothetical protein